MVLQILLPAAAVPSSVLLVWTSPPSPSVVFEAPAPLKLTYTHNTQSERCQDNVII